MTFLLRALRAGAVGTGGGGLLRGRGQQAEVPAPLTYLRFFWFLFSFFVLSDWRPALNLAALDCAQETNTAVCRDFNITGFPTVRVCDQGGRAGSGVVLSEHSARCSMLPWCLPGCWALWCPPRLLGLTCLNHSPWSTYLF